MERTQTLILFDTNELLQPLPRKLHAAWAELDGRKVNMTPTVAVELAPRGYPPDDFRNRSAAEERLELDTSDLTRQEERKIEQEAWWATMWRRDSTPYKLLRLSRKEQDLADKLERKMPHDCFTKGKPGYIEGHRDTKIICEALAVGGTVLLTSNIRSIKHNEVNNWAIANGDRLGFAARPVVQDTDSAILRSIKEKERFEKWLKAGIMACWPRDDNTPNQKIVEDAIMALEFMTEGRLPGAGKRLKEGLEKHERPNELVEAVRAVLPSPTISTDREHPSFPKRERTSRQGSLG